MHKKNLISKMSAATIATLMAINSMVPVLASADEGSLWFKNGKVTLEQADGEYYNYTSKLPFTAYDSPSKHAEYSGAVKFRNSSGNTTESIDLTEGGGMHQMVMYEMKGDGANTNLGICLRPTAHSFAAGFFDSDGKLVEYTSTNGYTGYWDKVKGTSTGKAIAAAMYYGYGGRVQGKSKSVADCYIATQLIVWELVCGYRDPKTMDLVTKDANGRNISTSSSLLDYYKPTASGANGKTIRENSSCKGIVDEYNKIAKSMKNWADTHNNFPNSLKPSADKVLLQYDFDTNKYTGSVDIKGAKGNWANATSTALKSQWGADNVSASGTVYTINSKSRPSSSAKTVISPIATDEYETNDSWVIYNHSADPRKRNSSNEDCQDLAFNAQVIDPVEGEINYVVANYADIELTKQWELDGNILDNEKASEYMSSISFTLSTKGEDGKDYYVQAGWDSITRSDYTFTGTTTDASEATKFRFNSGADSDTVLKIKNIPSDEDGTDYTVTESLRENSRAYNDGYTIEEPKSVHVGGYSLTTKPAAATVTFTNSKESIFGQVSLLKIDAENGIKLPGATFELWKDTNEDGNLDEADEKIGTLNDKNNGEYVSDDIEEGKYLVRETKAPYGYIADKTPIAFDITENGKTVTIGNTVDGNGNIVFMERPARGNIELNKIDSDTNEPISGAEFTVWKDENKNGVVDEEDTEVGIMSEDTVEFIPEDDPAGNDAEQSSEIRGTGTYRIGELRLGQYIVKETAAPENYIIDPNEYVAVVEAHEQTVTINNRENAEGFFEVEKKGKISLTKYDSRYPDHVLSGAEFDVWTDTNSNGIVDEVDEYLGRLVETANGIYEMSNLRVGDYLVHEAVAPEGFNLDEGYYPAAIREDGDISVVTNREEDGDYASGFYNDIKRGDIEITKTDIVTSEALPNTGFRIYDKDKNVIFEDYTDENGKITFRNLEYGEYYYQEYDAPEGYIIDETLYSFEIREDGVVVKADMTNRPKPAVVTITKTDISESTTLPNTGIRICREDGTVISEQRTGSDGSVTFEIDIAELGYGKYYFEEFDAPEGYLINEEKHWFEITTGGQVIHDKLRDEKVPKTSVIVDTSLPAAAGTGALAGLIVLTYVAIGKKRRED